MVTAAADPAPGERRPVEAPDGELPGEGARTGRVMANLRRTPLFRSLVPMEAGIGWPIPAVSSRPGAERSVSMRFPLFGMQPVPDRGVSARLFPPFATVSLDWKTLRVVEYVDLRFKGLWPDAVWRQPAGTFPHPEVAGSREDYARLRADVLDRYDELFDMISRDHEPSDEWVAGFGAHLRRIVEPDLLPYFRELGPKFFAKYVGAAAGER